MSSIQGQPHIVTSHGVVIDAAVLDELHAVRHRSLARCLLFIVMYVVAASVVCIVKPFAESWTAIGLCIPLYLIAAASLHGISLFTHEAVHGLLSRNPLWNRLLGISCAMPVLQNFSAYKVLHLRHHKHVGEEGDPDHYDNYSKWTWLVFSMHWLRLIAGYPIYVTMIPILGYRQATPSERRWIVLEAVLLAALAAAVIASPLAWSTVLNAWLIPMLIINTFVNIRGMSQHTFLEQPSDPVRGTRSILTNRVTEFFMCNENYHLEHHLFPRVPWYHLRKLHVEIRPQLEEREAPFVRSYLAFVVEFVLKSWRHSPWGRNAGA